jgi:murein DD-endopeptidase MepM/ murein hydrolase activator NlpD
MALMLEQFPIDPPSAVTRLRDSFNYHSHGGTDAHHAIDIFAPERTLIVAAVAGQVLVRWTFRNNRSVPGVGTRADNDNGGNYVILVDEQRFVHYHAHMAKLSNRRPGERVNAGDVIGMVGNTGRIAQHTAHHLHYQVYGPRRPTATAGEELPSEISARTDRYDFVNPFAELKRLYCLADPTQTMCQPRRRR